MLRVVGQISSPIDIGMPYTSLLVQAISGSLDVLPNTYAYIKLPETGDYDFNLLNGTYRVYANYENSNKIDILGECTVGDGMEEEMTLNELLLFYSPVPPDWSVDLDNKWNDILNDLINDANTRINAISQQVVDGDASVLEQMATYVNDKTGELAAALTEQVNAGDASVTNQLVAYTNQWGDELAYSILDVRNSTTQVQQELVAYKESNGNEIAEINNTIATNQANLGSYITAEVNTQTGAMELRIKNLIITNNASISEDMAIIEDALGNQVANWQVVAKVGDITSVVSMVNDGTSSTVYMQADSIILTNSPSASIQVTPFYLKNNTVYINSAMIEDATITNAMIQNASIDMLKIKGDLYSDNYVTQTRGWKLHRDGALELNGSSTSGRTIITNNLISTYDSAGQLRIRLGVW